VVLTLCFFKCDLRRYVAGEWSVMDTEWGRNFFDNFIDPPGVWFCLSVGPHNLNPVDP
jgi:hypothetical protein